MIPSDQTNLMLMMFVVAVAADGFLREALQLEGYKDGRSPPPLEGGNRDIQGLGIA